MNHKATVAAICLGALAATHGHGEGDDGLADRCALDHYSAECQEYYRALKGGPFWRYGVVIDRMTDSVSQHHATYRGDTGRLVVVCNAGSGGSFVVYSAPCLADVRFTGSVGPFFDAPARVRFDDGDVLAAEFTGETGSGEVNVSIREPGASFAQRLLDSNRVRIGDAGRTTDRRGPISAARSQALCMAF